jgi:hypothetical protein
MLFQLHYMHLVTCSLSPCALLVKLSIESLVKPLLASGQPSPAGKIKDFIKFDLGNLAMVTGGHNNGRVGTIVHKERHRCVAKDILSEAAGVDRVSSSWQ